jgi:hypothetical protein
MSATTRTKRAPFAERDYTAFMWICIAGALVVVAEAFANVYLKFSYKTCGGVTDDPWSRTASTPVCTAANLFPNWIVALIVLAIALAGAFVAFSSRDYWYREVRKGEVVNFSWSSSIGVYSSGYEDYRMCIYGMTRSGEMRYYWLSVQPKTYYQYQKGDTIDFGD